MSRHDRGRVGWLAQALCCALVFAASSIDAQTIADYSRAQRTLLENTMAQAAARSASLGASAPVAAASAPAAAIVTASQPAPRLPAPPPPLATSVQVSGVFASSRSTVAEILVNATAYLLGTGQGVPGTGWHVESIAIDRVVLSRRGAGANVDADGVRKVFALPALR